MSEPDSNAELPVLTPSSSDDDVAATSSQFSLGKMFVVMTLFGMLFGVCSALKLPPLQLLAAFAFSAITALVTIAIAHWIVISRASRHAGGDYLKCPRCSAWYSPSTPRTRCRYCGQLL